MLGPKRVVLIAYLFSSVLTILTPYFANLNKFALITCRFFIGIFHVYANLLDFFILLFYNEIRIKFFYYKGGIWPNMAGLWIYWVPMSERGRLIGMAYAGSQIGNASAFFFLFISSEFNF